MGVKLSDIPLLTNPPDGSTLVGIHNGTPVRFPKNAVGGNLTEGDAISISTVKGLTAYTVNCQPTTYMSSIKNAIESAGGDITRLNLVSLQGTSRGELILIQMVQAGSTSYQIKCVELNKLWSYYGFLEISSTLVSDFLKLSDSSNYDSRLEDLEDNITRKMNSYGYNVTHGGTTLNELITSLKAQGYTSNDPLILKLTGAVSGSFVGYINSWDSDTTAAFDLNKAGTPTFYSDSALETTVTLDAIFNTAHYSIDLLTEVNNLYGIVADLEQGGSSGGENSNSIPCISFGCYSPEFTVADLMNELPSEVVISGQPAIVSFMGMLNGTFLCRFSKYHSDYYGCEFTDITNLKTYRFEGESSTLSLYNNLSGESSEASMPKIRLSNWEYTTPAVMINRYPLQFEGEIKFSVCVQDGTVQEGDEIEICALRKTYGKYKLRQFSKRVITAEDIENLDKQPYLQITTDVKDFFRTDSAMEWNKKPKYIRIRRPIYKEGVEAPVSAIFSNIVPVDIGLSYTQ